MKCIEQKTYKETTLYLLSNGCMVQTNDDIEITEDIRLALSTIVKKAHDDRIDRLVDDISRRCKKKKKKKKKKMSNPCVKDLDAGQLDFMWNFLKFKGKDLSIHDIKGIKDNLDAIRQLMIQKTGGQENYKKSYELDINDLGTYVNIVVIQAMSIYLCGGFDILEKYCEEGD